MNQEKVDVEALMARIRERVRQTPLNGSHLPAQSQTPQFSQGKIQPLICAEELNFLNANWQGWISKTDITSHRPIIGPVIVTVKKLLRNFIWNSLFKEYFERERQFQMKLVRFLNTTARYIDARDAEVFWNTNHKLDLDTRAINERMDILFDSLQARLANKQ